MRAVRAVPLTPLPIGFGVDLDPGLTRLDHDTLFGGSPARAMRLTAAGHVAFGELRNGPVRTRAAATLGRRLTDAGLAHPRPPRLAAPLDLCVVIPVRDRPALLDRALAALGRDHPVVVVDDGSTDPAAVAEVGRRHGAQVIARAVNGGPGVARNAALAQTDSEFVAFIDSDCLPPKGWITALAAHFADPTVAAVAPRIVAGPVGSDHRSSWAARYSVAASSLDLGAAPARVEPRTRVTYVPTAALLVRRRALGPVDELALADQEAFDPNLRFGEDVDLVWRLARAGWRIRYDPTVEVVHSEPSTWAALLRRRFDYGTSAAPLAGRHPDAIAPLVVSIWPALSVAGVIARRPSLAVIGFAGAVLSTRRTLRRAGLPTRRVGAAMLTACAQTGNGVGRYAAQFGAPALLAGLILPSGHRHRGRRAVAALVWFGPPLATWAHNRPALDPVRFVLGRVADEVAYGAGVYAGCWRSGTVRPLLPVVSWKSFRTDPKRSSV